jgi:hypothetical protein
MPKRKANAEDGGEAEPLRRSTRQKSSATKQEEDTKPAPVKTTKKIPKKADTTDVSHTPYQLQIIYLTYVQEPKKAAKPTKVTKPTPKQQKEDTKANEPTTTTSSTDNGEGKNYWLLKAEPETRLEKGIDVRFSIDDLAARTEPEPWDGKPLPFPSPVACLVECTNTSRYTKLCRP